MKKVIFSLVFAAVVGISAVHINQSSDSSKPLGATALANIEALSRTESGYMYVFYIDYPWGLGCNCAGKGTKICCG